MRRRVVGLQADGFSILRDGALGLSRIQIRAREAKADDGIVGHQVEDFLELGDAIRLSHTRGHSTRSVNV